MALPEVLKKIKPFHIPMIWEMLHRHYGFALKPWQEKFEREFKLQPRGAERVEFMLIFGVRHINPVLNRILGREEEYSTFLMMVEDLTTRQMGSDGAENISRRSRRFR